MLDQAEPWRVWWLTRPSEHPFNTCIVLKNLDFPVLAPVGTSESEVESLIVEDVDADEASPPVVDPSALETKNRDGIQVFVDASHCVSTLSHGDSSSSIADI